MNVEPTIGLALLAGFVSFISPCVLPLIPAYVGYMSGQATKAAGQEGGSQFGTFLHGVFFVLGFTIFFVGFGLLTSAASSFLTSLGIHIPTILTRLGGVALILFGLYVMKVLDPVFTRGLKLAEWLRMPENQGPAVIFSAGVGLVFLVYYSWAFESIILAVIALLLTLALFRNALQTATNLGDFWYRAISSLQYALLSDTRNLERGQNSTGYLGSVGMGLVFAAGWTPCIGPIYGSILALAAKSASDTGSLISAGSMLTAYSLGLGIPFLAAALALNQMSGLMGKLKRNMRKVEVVSGGLVILIGVLVLSGNLEKLSRNFASGELGEISIRIEACTAGVGTGRMPSSSWYDCVSDGNAKLEDRVIFASLKQEPEASASDQSSGQQAADVPVGLEVGMRAPDFTSVTPDGQEFTLSELQGKIVAVNFWWVGCAPCRTEMPEFQTIYDEFKEDGFVIVGVNFLEDAEKITGFAEEIGVNFPLLLDESGEINDSYKVRAYPTTIIIDRDGTIIAAQRGILPGTDLVALLQEKIAVSGG